MSDQYFDWTALEEGGAQSSSLNLDVGRVPPEPKRNLSELLTRDDVSDSLKSLVNQHIELKQQLDVLTGKTSQPDADNWDKIRFPFPQHTAKSRLHDKKKARYEEKQRAIKRRRLEYNIIEKMSEAKSDLQAHLLKQKKLTEKSLERQREQYLTAKATEQKKAQLLNNRIRKLQKSAHDQARLTLRQQQRQALLVQSKKRQQEAFLQMSQRKEHALKQHQIVDREQRLLDHRFDLKVERLFKDSQSKQSAEQAQQQAEKNRVRQIKKRSGELGEQHLKQLRQDALREKRLVEKRLMALQAQKNEEMLRQASQRRKQRLIEFNQ